MTLKQELDAWKGELISLGEKEKALREQMDAIAKKKEDADAMLVASYMTAWRELPRQVRMKIRHAMNTEVSGQ